MRKKANFEIAWVLKNKLAIGLPPQNKEDFLIIKNHKIKSVLCLCSESEVDLCEGIQKEFDFNRVVLPDHNYEYPPNAKVIIKALIVLDSLIKKGPAFVHCKAGVERSPLICIAWLIKFECLNLNDALIYLKEVHKNTNPLDYQLKVLKQKEFISWTIK